MKLVVRCKLNNPEENKEDKQSSNRTMSSSFLLILITFSFSSMNHKYGCHDYPLYPAAARTKLPSPLPFRAKHIPSDWTWWMLWVSVEAAESELSSVIKPLSDSLTEEILNGICWESNKEELPWISCDKHQVIQQSNTLWISKISPEILFLRSCSPCMNLMF